MIARHLTKTLKTAANDYPFVTVTGPRQSGKTTLVRAAFPRHRYTSLEDPNTRAIAECFVAGRGCRRFTHDGSAMAVDPGGELRRVSASSPSSQLQQAPGQVS